MKTIDEADGEMLERGTWEIYLEFNGSNENPAMKVHEFLEKLIEEHKGENNATD